MLFYATPYNAEIAERLVQDGFTELREAVNNPDDEKHLIVNYLTNTFYIADNEAVEDTAWYYQNLTSCASAIRG